MAQLDAASATSPRKAATGKNEGRWRPDGVGFSELRSARRAAGVFLTTARLVVEGRVELDAPGLAERAQRTARALLRIHGVDLRCSGPLPRAPAILVTNHVSYLDPMVVAAVVPCLAIAKGEVRSWPLFGAGLHALGVIFVRRGDAHSGAVALRRTWRALRGGAMMLNFPEGTTSDGRAVGPFRPGIFGLAAMAGVQVIPAHISYDDDRVAWFGGRTLAPHYWALSRLAGLVARIRFAHPISVDASDDPSTIAARAREVVSSLASDDPSSVASQARQVVASLHSSYDH